MKYREDPEELVLTWYSFGIATVDLAGKYCSPELGLSAWLNLPPMAGHLLELEVGGGYWDGRSVWWFEAATVFRGVQA
jgi:hypothetical protein